MYVMPPTSHPDVLILGAGAAGLAAARACLAQGLSFVVLEARDRVGGRALTDHSLGWPVDLGATWLHAASRNPLTVLARELGFRLLNHDDHRLHRLYLDHPGDAPGAGRWATEAEQAEFDAAYDRWMEAVRAAPREPDPALATVAPRGGPWDASIAAWEGQTIAAAEPRDMGVADFLQNQLEPPNLLPEPGFGTLLTRLAEGLPILTGWPVERVRWSGTGVQAEGPRGVLEGRAAIVTLPASLLAAGVPRFDPPLPPEYQEALHGLPLGLLTKFILPARGEDRLDLPPFGGAERRVTEGETRMTFVAWPFGRPHLEGFLGGDQAWALEREGPAAQIAHAGEELARLYGARARQAIDWDRALVSRWGADPFSRGAYSYARPGAAGARAALSVPLADGRLLLAGEHCHPDLAGTVGGAWETGEAAAAMIATALSPGLG